MFAFDTIVNVLTMRSVAASLLQSPAWIQSLSFGGFDSRVRNSQMHRFAMSLNIPPVLPKIRRESSTSSYLAFLSCSNSKLSKLCCRRVSMNFWQYEILAHLAHQLHQPQPHILHIPCMSFHVGHPPTAGLIGASCHLFQRQYVGLVGSHAVHAAESGFKDIWQNTSWDNWVSGLIAQACDLAMPSGHPTMTKRLSFRLQETHWAIGSFHNGFASFA